MKPQGGKRRISNVRCGKLFASCQVNRGGRHHAQPTPPPHHEPHAPKMLALSFEPAVCLAVCRVKRQGRLMGMWRMRF